MLRLLLLRHAQSTWNAEGRWQGHADPPLSPEGKQTAKAAAPQYSHISRVVSSPLLRATETAEIIAESSGTSQITTHPGLTERNLGEWTGLTRSEVEERWPGYLNEHKWPQSAETTEAFIERVLEGIHSIAEEFESSEAAAAENLAEEADKRMEGSGRANEAEQGEIEAGEESESARNDVLVVAHAGVIITLEQSLGVPWRRIGNLCGRAIEYDRGKLRLGEELLFEAEIFDKVLFEDDLFSENTSSTTLEMGR